MLTIEVDVGHGKTALFDAPELERLKLASLRLNGAKKYVETSVKGGDGRWRSQLVHRLLMMAPRGMFVDHINGNGLDNRLCNLRLVTPAQNARNRGRMGRVDRIGVREAPGGFSAFVNPDGRQIYLGTFKTADVAGAVYDAAARVVFGEYARLNGLEGGSFALVELIAEKRRQAERLLAEISILEGIPNAR